MEKPSTKPSIIVFGCSFAQGSVRENFEYQLSKKTKRMVYNRGYSGLGIASMYAQVSNPDFYKLLYPKVNPEYAVYIFISDHIYRLYSDKLGLKEQIYIKENISPLKEGIKVSFLRQISRFYYIRRFLERYFFAHQLAKENNDKNFDLMKLYFLKSKDELQKRFPNIKFIIIKYPSKLIGEPAHEEIYDSKRWNELKKQGIKVIDLKTYVKADLTSEEYIFKDGHPNQKAWDIISDKLSNDINKGLI